MGLTDLIFRKQQVEITTLPPAVPLGVRFDASVGETHTDSAEVVSHPVETGIGITDHIRQLPDAIEISEIVTNTPIIFAASLQALAPANSPVVGAKTPSSDRVTAAYEALRSIQRNKALCQVKTSLRTYTNMAIETIAVRREAATGNVLDCTISMREVQFALSLSQDVPVPVDKAQQKAQNAGKKSKDAASSAQDAKTGSLLSSLAGSLFGA